MKKIKRIISFLVVMVILFAMILAFVGYQNVYAPNTVIQKEIEFTIENEFTSQDILSKLKSAEILKRGRFLNYVADLMSFHQSSPKPGRYVIQPGMSTYDILNMYRKGEQKAINLTIHKFKTLDDMSEYLGKNLMYSANEFRDHLKNSSAFQDTVMCYYLPDTYEFFWTVSPAEFESRMKSYHKKYWDSKGDVLKEKDLTPTKAYILASIVEKESAYDPEKPRIAGVYLNRIKRGIPLQADPTVLFALNDPNIRRVLYKHLEYPSPYNTYLNAGLPPGPICMPSRASIEAVAHAETHDYLYFCAKADGSGKHAFAKTLSQHNRNARALHQWMNKQGIR